ncbi:MAG: metal ABC transporter permease [bacterium]
MPDIFTFDFMIRAFIAGTVVAITAPLIGTFLVVKRYTIMSDTLAHVSLTGVAIGIITRANPILAALLISIVAALSIELLRWKSRISGEAVLAIFLYGGMAIAVVIISVYRGFNIDIFSVLFGSITTTSTVDLYEIVILGFIVIAAVLLFYRRLFFVSVDEPRAEVSGINVRIYNILIILLAGTSVALSMNTVGTLLIGALMVIPVLTAMQISKSFSQSMMLAIVVSLVSVYAGLFISYYIGGASGGSIILVSLFLFIVSLVSHKFMKA